MVTIRRDTVLLFLHGCGGAGPECDSLDARNSVVKMLSDDSNNAFVDYAATNSSAVEAEVNGAALHDQLSACSSVPRDRFSWSGLQH